MHIRTTQNRADMGAAMLVVYAKQLHQEDEDARTNMIDLLADLMHCAKAEEFEFGHAILTAKMHFDAEVHETNDDPAEAPDQPPLFPCPCTECVYLRKLNQPTHHGNQPLYGCETCGCTDIESSTWVNMNTREEIGGDAPTDSIFCPQCEADCTAHEVPASKSYVPPPAHGDDIPLPAADPIEAARHK